MLSTYSVSSNLIITTALRQVQLLSPLQLRKQTQRGKWHIQSQLLNGIYTQLCVTLELLIAMSPGIWPRVAASDPFGV